MIIRIIKYDSQCERLPSHKRRAESAAVAVLATSTLCRTLEAPPVSMGSSGRPDGFWLERDAEALRR